MSDFVIGLTGGVASGKTAATRAFEALDVHVADADIAARDAVAIGSDGLAEVVHAFGMEVLSPDGSLDRAAMRQRIFADPTARARLEAIIHPRVRRQLEAACRAAPGPYAVAAIPLLAEGGRGAYPWIARVLVIDVPLAVQIARLLQRDGIDVKLAQDMIAAQADRSGRLAFADDVIVNDSTLTALAQHAAALDALYRRLASPGQ